MKKDGDLILIQKAMNLEKERYNYYRDISKTAVNTEGKEVLIKIAKIERMHYTILKKQIESIKKFKKINLDVLESREIKLVKRERNFNKTLSLSNDINITEKAERLERRDPLFYAGILKLTKNRELKKVFQFLKNEEEKHLRMLRLKLKDLQVLSSKLSASEDPRMMFYNMTTKS